MPKALPSTELLQALNRGSLDAEIVAEKAASLGHHGRMVERTLAALRAFDADPGAHEERVALVKAAAREAWKFLIQRELCGLRDQREVIRFYGIPQEVLVRMGEMDAPAAAAQR